ncbi:tail fiber protein [Pseudonocardia sp. 73-21]|uniref:tail fiber protein n=1 Tax=Pseudonocardia sp. 73-21 TaxID=1895809 RepID=UPI000960AC49|nr:tail fiber protein [Pseudonocardia sp. 73-21]OJY47587.1 MAG: hypothetical protein BGP03_33180 [Pseudonocardia sp. 73-21]
MADDRPVGDVVDELATLKKVVEDMRTTLMARTSRRPTGDIEPTIRTSAKPDTLLLQGQSVSRAAYPVLWQWVQDQGLVAAGLFTVGDGSTTFGVPDYRGRVVRGTPTGEAVGLLSGADTKAIATTNLPSHTHGLNGDGNHGHSFSTDGAGTHGGHNSGSFGVAGGTAGAVSSNGNTSDGFHSHTGGTTNVADHNHGGVTTATGSGTAFDVRQASINVNWLIYV